MLGALEVRADSGEPLELGGSRLRALLIMLALRPGQVVPASELIDGLWADQLAGRRRQRPPGPGLPPAPGAS
jgi:DNA-binding SARP family transcriptional activator